MRRAAALLALVLAAAGPLARAQGPEEPVPAAEELIRRVVRSQRAAEKRLDSYTFDRRDEVTDYRPDGKVKEVKTRLLYVLAGAGGGSSELVEVDGRPATEKEKAEAAEKAAKAKKKLEGRAAARAAEKPMVGGDEDDPTIGEHRLSELLRRFDVQVTGRELVSGRATWVVAFAPRPGEPERGLGERALGALAGTAWVDAEDLQVRRVDARLVRPVRVAGGLLASVKRGEVAYEAEAVVPGYWFPVRISLRLSGKKALFFPLDTLYRFELSGFRTFAVETESTTGPPP